MHKIWQYITPLRALTIILIVVTVRWSIIISESIENGYNPELGGIVPWIFGGIAFISFLLDLILSIFLDTYKNWIVQGAIIIGVVIVAIIEVV